MIALHSYKANHGSFPPAFIADEHGRPMHSWRVLILPYMEEESLYEKYDFNEPWDGPNNKKLLNQMPNIYRCPSHGHHGKWAGDECTNYVLVTGENAVFASTGDYTPDYVPDGATDDRQSTEKNKIVLVDVNRRSVPWTSPQDIAIDEFLSMFGQEPDEENAQNHNGNLIVVGYADAHTRVISLDTDPSQLREMTVSDRGPP